MVDETKNPDTTLEAPPNPETESVTGNAAQAEANAKTGTVPPAANSDGLPLGTAPNPIASGEGIRVSDKDISTGDTPSKTPLVGQRREEVWQLVHRLEAKVTEVYGHMHDDVIEIITDIRGKLIGPSN